jgi:hypothetical protein
LRRAIVAAVAAAITVLPTTSQASITERNERLCQFQHIDRAAWTPREEARTARCVTDRFGPIPGGLPKLRDTLQCESGWNRWAYNAIGPYVGLAQHDADAWHNRVRWYQPNRWPALGERWTNSRTQLVVTVRMVHAGGWAAWSCA